MLLTHVTTLLSVLALMSQPVHGTERLSVYGPVPGLAPSPYYRLQVREQGEQAWRDTFTLLTECTAEKFCNTTGVSRHLNNWSNSYVNFQMEDGVRQGLNHEKSMELFVYNQLADLPPHVIELGIY